MLFDPASTTSKTFYKLMTGSIVPRPIGWVSTVNAAGQPNLAPFSFFNAVCSKPPTLLFCPGMRENHVPKDTLANVRETGQFVVNIVTQATAETMYHTSLAFPPGVDEFGEASLTPIPSEKVRPPRVAESPIHYECEVTQIVDLGDEVGATNIVIGRVVMLHIQDELVLEGDKIDIEQLRPIGRLAGSGYCRVRDLFQLPRE